MGRTFRGDDRERKIDSYRRNRQERKGKRTLTKEDDGAERKEDFRKKGRFDAY